MSAAAHTPTPDASVAVLALDAEVEAGQKDDPKCYEIPGTDFNGFDILPNDDKLMLPSPDACCAACACREFACSTTPPWGGSIRFRPPTRTYAPWGVRVDELAK